jgi:hypothetical protein
LHSTQHTHADMRGRCARQYARHGRRDSSRSSVAPLLAPIAERDQPMRSDECDRTCMPMPDSIGREYESRAPRSLDIIAEVRRARGARTRTHTEETDASQCGSKTIGRNDASDDTRLLITSSSVSAICTCVPACSAPPRPRAYAHRRRSDSRSPQPRTLPQLRAASHSRTMCVESIRRFLKQCIRCKMITSVARARTHADSRSSIARASSRGVRPQFTSHVLTDALCLHACMT